MLVLPTKGKWFWMVFHRIKKEEYREVKPYYTARFWNALKLGGKPDEQELVDMIVTGQLEYQDLYFVMRNGYSADSPSFLVKCSLKYGAGRKEWGADGKETYRLAVRSIYPAYCRAEGQTDSVGHEGWLVYKTKDVAHVMDSDGTVWICKTDFKILHECTDKGKD